MKCSVQKEVEACREAVLRLALAYPEVEFVLSSVKPGRQLLWLSKASILPGTPSDKLYVLLWLQHAASLCCYCTICNVCSNAMQGRHVTDVLPLIFGEQCNNLHEVAYATRSLSIQGYVTIPPASFGHKHKQYLYVNHRHVRAGQLSKLVNSLFRHVMSKLEHAEEPLRKTAQQYPAFALQITCPRSSYDITSEPDKSHVEFADWPDVLTAVQAAVLVAWHSVVGDKLLAGLLQDRRHTADLPARDLTIASASTDHAATAASTQGTHFLPSSKTTARHSSPAVSGVKRKRTQEQGACFIDTDVTSTKSLFGTSAQHHNSHTSAGMKSDGGISGNASEMQDNSAFQSLPPQAAPRGLLHRLQSSVKLKFAQVPSPESQKQRQQQQENASSATPGDAGHLELASLLDDKREADQSMPWFPLGWSPHQFLPAAVGHRSAAEQAPGRLPHLPETSSPVDMQSSDGHRQATLRRSRSTHQWPCKRRAVSAPPHYRAHWRSAHTNPLHSLHTDLHERLLPYTPSPGVATTWATSTAEQAPQNWMLNRQARQQHTVSGVCNQLRHQLSGVEQAQLTEAFRQKRHSSSSRSGRKTAQMPSRTPFTGTVAPSHHHTATDAVHDSFSPVQSDVQLRPQASRKRVRFEPSMDDLPPANDYMSEPLLPVPTPDIPTTPHLSLPAAQLPHQQAPTTPMTATPSASAVAGLPAQPVELNADVLLAQQTSLAVPSIIELLQSWCNPSIRPHASRSIADLASVCGSGLHTVLPTAIARSDFLRAHTLRQMENKFIAVVCNGTLSIIDQHAADERVRLERLRAAVLGSQVGWHILSCIVTKKKTDYCHYHCC